MRALWIAGALLWSCRGPPCEECGLGEICVEGVCVVRYCATSTECPLGFYCTEDGDCAEGCQQDPDCGAGQLCVEGQCAERECADTQIDCDYREYCTDGACIDAGESYCASCSSDEQCGPGNLCWAGEWCGVDCEGNRECPAGFECVPVEHEGEERQVCMAACWMMVSLP